MTPRRLDCLRLAKLLMVLPVVVACWAHTQAQFGVVVVCYAVMLGGFALYLGAE